MATKTNLFSNIFEICEEQIYSFEWSVSAFISFGVVVPSGTLCNDIIKEMQQCMDLRKVPVLDFSIIRTKFLLCNVLLQTLIRGSKW